MSNVESMPYGKHKGKPLTTIDTTYLEWVVMTTKTPGLVQKCSEIIQDREHRTIHFSDASRPYLPWTIEHHEALIKRARD